MTDYSNCEAIIDADTILYMAAASIQENYIIVTHKKTGWTKEFKGVREFYGTKKDRLGGWIGETNKRTGKEPVSADDFDIEQTARVKDEDYIAMGKINFKISDILQTLGVKKYCLLIGGDENYRRDLAQARPYKEKRPPKPIRFAEVREWMVSKFTNYVDNKTGVEGRLIVCEGQEADDKAAQFGHEDFLHRRATSEHKYVICYIDKDLDMIIAPRFNYNKIKEPVVVPTPFECAKAFCIQMLIGDATDDINGLPNLTPSITEKYHLRATRGVGKTSALAVLDRCNTIKCLYQRVVECYKAYYEEHHGEEPHNFVSFRGEKSKRTWIDYLDENINLLYMRRKENEKYDTRKVLQKMGIINEQGEVV